MANSMQDLFQLLPSLIKAFPDNEDVRQAVVFAVWQKVCGDGLGPHSIPIELNKGRLFVVVRDKIWKRNLESMAPQLIYRVNRLLASSEVKFIEFQIDENAFISLEPNTKSKVVDTADQPKAIIEELTRKSASISDPSLRRKFLETAQAYLAKRDRIIK